MTERLEIKTIGVMFIILLVMLVVSVTFINVRYRADLHGLAAEKIAALSKAIAVDVERELMTGHIDSERVASREKGAFRGVESVSIFGKGGRDTPATWTELVVKVETGGIAVVLPLSNRPECRGCHAGGDDLLGWVKVVGNLKEEKKQIARFAVITGGAGLLGTIFLGAFLWLNLRRQVVTPLAALGAEAAKMADGDLSFAVDVGRRDEIGRLQRAIGHSLGSLSGILRRVDEVTRRVAHVAARVERDSARVVESTELETSAITDISGSVEELNASIREISENVEELAASAEETATSTDEMVASIRSVGLSVHDLSDGVQSTSSSIEELSATLREVAAGAEELALVSDTTLSGVEQIVTSVRDIERKVKESARLSERDTEEASTIGASSMEKAAQGMLRIRGSVEKTAGVLEKLGGRSEEIGEILTIIIDITDQTRLLSLNASILSAQAGEKGKGFSIVAEEMKGLAARTASSAKEIASLIDGVRTEVKTAVENMDEALESVAEGTVLSREAAASFGKILESARSSSEMTLAIERTTEDQAQAAMMISDSLARVRSMVQRMAQATSEQSKGISLIVNATEKIRDAALQVRTASDQQMETSALIARAVDSVSDRSRSIARSIGEQRVGAGQICGAIERIKDLPRQSKDTAFRVNRTLREIVKDVELIRYEMESFTLHAEDANVLRFGIIPQESPVAMYKRYAPLARYLAGRLGRKVELRVAPNFETAVRELEEGVTSLCSMTSRIYIEAHRKFGAETLAVVLRSGRSFHHSVIVSRTGVKIGSVKDLKGRSFAFVDEKAAAGYVIPRAMLQEEGVELADLSYHNFTGAHDEVARAVLRGEFDAGGLMESTAEKYPELAVLKVSEKVPDLNICCHGLGIDEKRAVREALLALDEKTPEGAAVLNAIESGCSGFAVAADADHDGMRGMMSRIGILQQEAVKVGRLSPSTRQSVPVITKGETEWLQSPAV